MPVTSHPQSSHAYLVDSKFRRVDPWAMVAATVVITLGSTIFFLWPKIQSAFGNTGAPQASIVADAADGPPAAQPQATSATRSSGPPAAPPHNAGHIASQPKDGTSAAVLPSTRTAEALTLSQAVELQAGGTLPAFLDGYCSDRATKVGQKVVVKSVTWWPGGTGVIVEMDEGGQYRQGTAQFIPKQGWKWLLRPDAPDTAG